MAMGTVTVSYRAVMQLASHIAKRHKEVARLTDKKNSDGIARTLKGERDTKGVYLTKSKKGLELEICIVCRYGANTVSLCGEISETIKTELCQTGFKIKSVNVHIMGVE